MEFNEVLIKRKTTRKFLNKPVSSDVIKRILEIADNSPSCNHSKNWHFIVLSKDEEKEFVFKETKAIADNFDLDKYLNRPRPYPLTLGQKMYGYAMPLQYSMLMEAPFVIIPVFKCDKLNVQTISELNSFATIWCVIENIFLAATNEGLSYSMRIPLKNEHEKIKERLKVPSSYMIPVFIGIGYPDPNEVKMEKKKCLLRREFILENGDKKCLKLFEAFFAY